jgi:hypothetical protein
VVQTELHACVCYGGTGGAGAGASGSDPHKHDMLYAKEMQCLPGTQQRRQELMDSARSLIPDYEDTFYVTYSCYY